MLTLTLNFLTANGQGPCHPGQALAPLEAGYVAPPAHSPRCMQVSLAPCSTLCSLVTQLVVIFFSFPYGSPSCNFLDSFLSPFLLCVENSTLSRCRCGSAASRPSRSCGCTRRPPRSWPRLVSHHRLHQSAHTAQAPLTARTCLWSITQTSTRAAAAPWCPFPCVCCTPVG